ncbi:ribonuclease HIII [Amphibacillus sediminis]|uniref:ribonuclease HIII n=1 Tax=Amphibacillus sediminis TaxID=360185 RepID=UPI000832C1BE|nr:ribonuclease HIII [Amphibacillus sediminis]
MGQIVLNVPDQIVKEMKQAYQSYLKPSPPGAIFSAKVNAITITGYKSGKVLFQGGNPEFEATKWEKHMVEPGDGTGTKNASKLTHNYYPDQALLSQSIIGSDEAGTGDYFGPITVAAVYAEAKQIDLLKELGVRDSKNLTDQSIQQIAKQMLLLNLPYSLVVLHNPKYNQLQQQGWTQGKMKALLHHTAISHVLDKLGTTKPAGIVIDQFCQPEVYLRHLKSENKQLPEQTYFMTKAESHSIAVAAASILARARFVQEMARLSKQVGFELPKGASAKVDQVAARLIKQHGMVKLKEFAKLHFANTTKARNYLN